MAKYLTFVVAKEMFSFGLIWGLVKLKVLPAKHGMYESYMNPLVFFSFVI